MKVFVLFLSLFLGACSLGYEVQSLEEYFLINNYVQDQNISSKNKIEEVNELEPQTMSAWAQSNYPKNCEWFDYDRSVDGDTIIVEQGDEQIRVRMIGIDTPESKRENTPIQPYALEASAALKDLLRDQVKVCLLEDKVGDKYDTYGRKLSYVFTDDGVDLNAKMIQLGWAEAYTRFPMERKNEFEVYERVARNANLGQWQ